jgi:hypothetical protein
VAADQPQPRHQRTLGARAGLRPCNKGKAIVSIRNEDGESY